MLFVPLCGLAQSHNCGAEAAGLGRSVGPVVHKRRALENHPHHLTLHPNALAVDYSNALETFLVGQLQVFLDNSFDIARRDGV